MMQSAPQALQVAQRREHLGHGILSAVQDGGCPVRDCRVPVDIDADMLVVPVRPGPFDDFAVQVCRCQRTHTAENADRFFHFLFPCRCLLPSRR